MKPKLIFLLIMTLVLASSVQAVGLRLGATLIGNDRAQSENIPGLEQATLHVRTQEQQQHIEQVMSMIMEQSRERLQQLDNLLLEQDGNGVLAYGRKEALLFGLIRAQHTYEYRIDENGSLWQNQRPFDFVWREIEEE